MRRKKEKISLVLFFQGFLDQGEEQPYMPISVKAETKPQWKGQEPTHTSVKGKKQVWIHPLLLSEMKLKRNTPNCAAPLLTQAPKSLYFIKNL